MAPSIVHNVSKCKIIMCSKRMLLNNIVNIDFMQVEIIIFMTFHFKCSDAKWCPVIQQPFWQTMVTCLGVMNVLDKYTGNKCVTPYCNLYMLHFAVAIAAGFINYTSKQIVHQKDLNSICHFNNSKKTCIHHVPSILE